MMLLDAVNGRNVHPRPHRRHPPRPDSICKFRRENQDLLTHAFHQVLELAARARILQVGNITVAIDGIEILANASKHSAVSHGHAVEQTKLAREQIGQLLRKTVEPVFGITKQSVSSRNTTCRAAACRAGRILVWI